MNIVALVTGRGNNTLKDKNIIDVLGHPLMHYPCIAAKKSRFIQHFYVSSDDDKILECGIKNGFKAIKRPNELSLPTSQHIDAIKHAIGYITKSDNIIPDILVVLLANNATVKTKWIDQSIEMIFNDKTISAVCPAERDQDHHPFRAKTIDNNGFLQTFFDFTGKDISTNRQDLSPCYFLCHNFWTLNVSKSIMSNMPGQQPWDFLGNKIKAIEVSGCFDVHDANDIKKTKEWILENFNEYK